MTDRLALLLITNGKYCIFTWMNCDQFPSKLFIIIDDQHVSLWIFSLIYFQIGRQSTQTFNSIQSNDTNTTFLLLNWLWMERKARKQFSCSKWIARSIETKDLCHLFSLLSWQMKKKTKKGKTIDQIYLFSYSIRRLLVNDKWKTLENDHLTRESSRKWKRTKKILTKQFIWPSFMNNEMVRAKWAEEEKNVTNKRINVCNSNRSLCSRNAICLT